MSNSPYHLDKPAFLTWVQGREGPLRAGGRSRRHDGGGVASAWDPGDESRRDHASAARSGQMDRYCRFRSRHRAQNRCDIRTWWSILPAGEPVITVATAPALIAEVLSPLTADIDLGDKAAEYLQLPSLSAYLVFAQREPKAWVWSRGAGGFPAVPSIMAGNDKVMHVAAFRAGHAARLGLCRHRKHLSRSRRLFR